MKAIILAAGEGKRLRPLTENIPKSMVQIWGFSFLQRQLIQLRSLGINDITVVTGYKSKAIESLEVETIYNEDYANSNMVFSLSKYPLNIDRNRDEKIILLYGDIAYKTAHLKTLIKSEHKTKMTLLANNDWLSLWSSRFEDPLSDAETFIFDKENLLIDIGKKPISLEQVQSQYTGMIKITAAYLSDLMQVYLRDLKQDSTLKQMYMTDLIQRAADEKEVSVTNIHGGWVEMDTIEDYRLYESQSLEYYELDKV